jgi:2,3-bisphosphoglycerate-independent phosphoglycerate mutase
LFAGRDAVCHEHGTLSDIAPTMLTLMGLPIPAEMSKHLLIEPKA